VGISLICPSRSYFVSKRLNGLSRSATKAIPSSWVLLPVRYHSPLHAFVVLRLFNRSTSVVKQVRQSQVVNEFQHPTSFTELDHHCRRKAKPSHIRSLSAYLRFRLNQKFPNNSERHRHAGSLLQLSSCTFFTRQCAYLRQGKTVNYMSNFTSSHCLTKTVKGK